MFAGVDRNSSPNLALDVGEIPSFHDTVDFGSMVFSLAGIKREKTNLI